MKKYLSFTYKNYLKIIPNLVAHGNIPHKVANCLVSIWEFFIFFSWWLSQPSSFSLCCVNIASICVVFMSIMLNPITLIPCPNCQQHEQGTTTKINRSHLNQQGCPNWQYKVWCVATMVFTQALTNTTASFADELSKVSGHSIGTYQTVAMRIAWINKSQSHLQLGHGITVCIQLREWE